MRYKCENSDCYEMHGLYEKTSIPLFQVRCIYCLAVCDEVDADETDECCNCGRIYMLEDIEEGLCQGCARIDKEEK